MTTLPRDSTTSSWDPTVHEGVVYVGISRLWAGPAGTGGLAAVDAATGTILWIREFEPEFQRQSSGCLGGALAYGANIIVASEDGRIFALDRASGEIRWTAPRVHTVPTEQNPFVGSYNDKRPLTLAGDIIVAGSTTGIIAGIEATTGRELWRSSANAGSAFYRLTNDGTRVFLTHLGGVLAAMDVRNGAIHWQVGREYRPAEFTSASAVDDDRIYVSGEHGFYTLRAE